tara:strand:+ start:397 stop:1335 length:939 start_codon:yes stop_codon:yes gene_type:complete
MRANPVDIILNKGFKIDKKFFLISGNENTLMQRIREVLTKLIKVDDEYNVEKIKNISSKKNGISLFGAKNLYLVSDVSGLNNDIISAAEKEDGVFIFFSENSPKIKLIKNIFIKRTDCLLIDCYELTRDQKSKIISSYLVDTNIKLDEGLFWELVDMLDNKYMVLENELIKLKELDPEKINGRNLQLLLSRNSIHIEKLFFQILNDNSSLIQSYNKIITNDTDVNSLYYLIKQYAFMIIDNDNQSDFEKRIPSYLFREKNFLISLYNKYNNSKKKLLLNLLIKTEKSMRTYGGLTSLIGLRFLLNFRKITIS